MLKQSITAISEMFFAEISANRDNKIINSAIAKILQDEPLEIKEYDKLIHFLTAQIKITINVVETNAVLVMAKQELQDAGNFLVQDHLILSNGRLPNAALLVGFMDPSTQKKYVILITNNKFKQYTTPAGKLDKADMIAGHSNEAEEKAYVQGALREFCEEALDPTHKQRFMRIAKKAEINVINRAAYGIPEFDIDSDTRLLTLNLGNRCSFELMQTLLKTADPHNEDATEAFIMEADALAWNTLEQVPDGKFTQHFLSRRDYKGDELKLAVRYTTIVVLHGPEGKPELGFINTIGLEPKGHNYNQQSFAKHSAIQPIKNASSSDEDEKSFTFSYK